MNIFKKLFGDGKSNRSNNERQWHDLTHEQFFNTDYIKGLIEKYRRSATLLRPHKSDLPISNGESKFRGIPNLAGFNIYPFCSSCNTPLNFVIQLYKKDFPAFYFPDKADLFQLFRCPNEDCPDAYSEQYDHKMFHYYFSLNETNDKELVKPKHQLTNAETEIPDCILKPKVVDDFPDYADFEEDDFTGIENKFGNDLSELFMGQYTAVQNSKFGGYPSYTQSPFYPRCSCGNTKEFFFQLSSEDIEDGIQHPPPPDKWSPHGIMIGDVGNIYFYVCKSCGQETIESYWDCY